MSTSIKKLICGRGGGGGSINIPCKIPDGKVLVHLGFKSKVLPMPLTDLSGWWTSTPQAPSRVSNVDFDKNKIRDGSSINIPCKIPDDKFLAHFGV